MPVPEAPTSAVAAEPAAAPRRQPVFVVCSPRPGVGCTLIARLLVDYLAADGRRALAFDVNPDNRALARHLPLRAIPADIADTRGKMALFDRLIVNDGAPKVVDLAADRFDQFFAVMGEVGFAGEARARAIDVVVLFVTGGDRKSEEAHRRLFTRRGLFTIVPVENALNQAPGGRAMPLPAESLPPLRIGRLPLALVGAIDRPGFSFADAPAALDDWTKRTFLAFRNLELRLQMAEFADVFRLFAE
jgi:hypothetical protein